MAWRQVFCYCAKGISRSSSLVIAFLASLDESDRMPTELSQCAYALFSVLVFFALPGALSEFLHTAMAAGRELRLLLDWNLHG